MLWKLESEKSVDLHWTMMGGESGVVIQVMLTEVMLMMYGTGVGGVVGTGNIFATSDICGMRDNNFIA
jgi:hypothetical protein